MLLCPSSSSCIAVIARDNRRSLRSFFSPFSKNTKPRDVSLWSGGVYRDYLSGEAAD